MEIYVFTFNLHHLHINSKFSITIESGIESWDIKLFKSEIIFMFFTLFMKPVEIIHSTLNYFIVTTWRRWYHYYHPMRGIIIKLWYIGVSSNLVWWPCGFWGENVFKWNFEVEMSSIWSNFFIGYHDWIFDHSLIKRGYLWEKLHHNSEGN